MTDTRVRPLGRLGQRPLSRACLAGCAGACVAFGLAPYGIWPIAVLGWAVLPALALHGTDPRSAAWIGWAFQTGFFLHALIWIVEPFLVDAPRHGWMAPFAVTLLSAGLAAFWGVAFWGVARVTSRWSLRLCLLVPALALAEFARAYILTGFPWAAPAQALVDSPVLPLLAWIGPHGVGALGLAVATGLGALPFVSGVAARSLALSPMALTIVVAGLASAQRADVVNTDATVRLVQPNAAQHEKWDPALIPIFFERQLGYTAAEPKPDLVVWPENAVPVFLENGGAALARIAEAAQGAQLALGIQRFDEGRFFNALVRLDGDGDLAGVYDKHHLVPFGEYMPFGQFLKRFGIKGLAADDGNGYSAGPGPHLLDFGALGHGLPLICYEAVFPQDVHGAPGRADFLLQVTNDAWFGAYSGPHQHLAQARMRAVEQGLPAMRAANTGISAMIDPHGRITKSLALGVAGYIDAALPAPLPPTLYARSGDAPFFWLTLCLMGIGLVVARTTKD